MMLDPDAIRTPDSFEPLVGFRSWTVGPRTVLHLSPSNGSWPLYDPADFKQVPTPEGHVSSLMSLTVWSHEYPLESVCVGRVRFRMESHATMSPKLACSCGIYGMYKLDLEEHLRGAPSNVGPLVVGAISAWGKVIQATRGFRAQKARIIGFLHPSAIPDGVAVSYSEVTPQRLADAGTVWGLGWLYDAKVYESTDELAALRNVFLEDAA